MIRKVLNLIKTNLLGIAVTFGVCAFLYEGLVKHNSNFTLTKYAVVLIIFVAIYFRKKDNLTIQKQHPKENYVLTWKHLKGYLKQRLIGVPALIVVFSLLYYFDKDKFFAYGYLTLWFASLIEGFFSYEKRQDYLAELKRKGLTEQQIINEEFIKQWDENRERGLVKYCIVDGGIIAGALVSLLVSIVGMFILNNPDKRMFADGPGEIFQFIGISYLIGAIIGMVSYRITWYINERKFNRLAVSLR